MKHHGIDGYARHFTPWNFYPDCYTKGNWKVHTLLYPRLTHKEPIKYWHWYLRDPAIEINLIKLLKERRSTNENN